MTPLIPNRPKRHLVRRLVYPTLGAVAFIGGCASVVSTVDNDQSKVGDGVIYYMPQRPIAVSIQMPSSEEVKKGKQPVPSIDPIAPAPDYTHRFLLAYSSNLLGKNHLKIGVSSSGLLTSSDADTNSSIPDIVRSLGTLAGYASTPAPGPGKLFQPNEIRAPSQPECLPGRIYTKLFSLDPKQAVSSHDTLCQFDIEVKELDGRPLQNAPLPDTKRLADPDAAQAGFFYRQDRSFRVDVKDPNGGPASSFIAFSPNLSPIAFLPVSRSFFSDNHTNAVFNNGTLTSVDTQIDGEVAALVKLPADFIEAYMKAVGGLFTSFGDNTKAKSTAIDNQRALTLSTTQRQVCDLAVQANRPTLQIDPNTPLTPDRITAIASATQAVKAACSP